MIVRHHKRHPELGRDRRCPTTSDKKLWKSVRHSKFGDYIGGMTETVVSNVAVESPGLAESRARWVMDTALRQRVRDRAGHRCEYCRLGQVQFRIGWAGQFKQTFFMPQAGGW